MLQDRERIARDLHDLVIQRLYATGMSLQGAMPLVGRPEVADRVSRAVDALDDTIGDIRSAIFALQARPDIKPAQRPGAGPADHGRDDRAARVRALAAASPVTWTITCPTTSPRTC